MPLEELKIKLIRNRDSSGMELPLYTITYKANPKKPFLPSFEILNAMADKSDVFIELSSDLYSGGKIDGHEYIKKYINVVNPALEGEYRTRRVQSARRSTIMGFLLESKKKMEADELVIHISNHTWTDGGFSERLPVGGAKYYMLKESAETAGILDEFWNMSEMDKAKTFKFILFDNPMLGTMGILACSADENELRELLRIR